MKAFFKNKLKVKNLKLGLIILNFGVLSVLFNNCSQPGEIVLTNDLSNSTLSEGDVTTPDGQLDSTPGGTTNTITYKKISSKFDVRSIQNNKVDILIVIDNSGSMNYEQVEMANRFSGFIKNLNGLDWQIGITTTDMVIEKPLSDGRLIKFENNAFILSSQNDPALVTELFSKAIQRPKDEGSSREQGVNAIYRAIKRTELSEDLDTTHNRELFRQDASLAVVVVSDADETPFENVISDYNNPEKLLSYMKEKWPQKVASIHSIIVKSDDKVCLEDPLSKNESYGKAYEFLSKATSGIVGSVCEADYSGQLKIMGLDIKDKVNSIKLTCAPVDSDNDMVINFSLKNSQGVQITNFKLSTDLVMLPEDLPPGSYDLEYSCVDIQQMAK